MLKVIGIERKKGTYQGFEFDNYVCHCVDDPVNSNDKKGTMTEIIKLKAKDVEKLNPFTWINKKIEIYYDKYQKPIHINISD